MAPPLRHHHLLLVVVVALASSAIASSSNPFTPKSAFLRYYGRKVPGNRPLPSFLLSKLSPLSASNFSHLLSSPSTSLPSFCSSANLLCAFPSLSSLPPSSSSSSSSNSTDFATYSDSNFTNYGTSHSGGKDSFRSYSDSSNLPVDTFRRYSRSSSSRDDSFDSYAHDGNVVTASFASYATSSVAGSGSFSSYAHKANVPDLKFTSYDTESVSRPRSFKSYSDDANSGDQSFAGYGKNSEDSPASFASYAANSNHFGSGFKGYGEDGNSVRNNFTSYGSGTNHPENSFKQYGESGNDGSDRFTSYVDQANAGDSSFQSYAKHANAQKAGFDNYGNSFNPGTDLFKGYGEESGSHEIGFKNYHGDNTTFKAYAKTGITFSAYKNSSVVPDPQQAINLTNNNRWVEPGRFFRERSLKKGTPMTMADIRDRSPRRSFLPRPIAAKLPFSAAELSGILRMPLDSALGKAMSDTVAECRRAPSRGETKRCATSAEDMVDFAVSVLGDDVAARSTESARGYGKGVVIGEVRGGDVTKSVSCHQSLFPFLVYYCHSVPKVRVYEADIHEATGGNEKINHGVAICHLDTSDWSPTHGAFLALGHKPGEIEVCHWIFEGDMTWTVADH